MPGITPKFETGPKTYEVTEQVTGGMLVEAITGTATQAGLTLVRVARANSAAVEGVATRDAIPNASQAAMQTGTSADGYQLLNIAVPSESVAVVKRGQVPLTYAAAATYRQPLKAAANGQVTPFVPGTDDPGLRIGYCEEQAGVAAGAVGQTWVNII